MNIRCRYLLEQNEPTNMREKLICKFKFHNVGQGLFYTGLLQSNNKKYEIVYDCGSDNRTYRMKAIRDYKTIIKNDDKIDLLIISHLHTDHYNGIKELLKNRGAKIAILPYVPLWERMIIKFISKRNSWSDSFLDNPSNFLINECNVDEVIMIDNSDPDGEDNPFQPDGFSPNPDSDFDLKKMKFKANSTSDEKLAFNTQTADSGGVLITLNRKWFFSFYNNPLTKELRWQFTQTLNTSGINLSDSDSVVNLLKKYKNNRIAAAYKKVFGVGDELNITSLITIHGPCGKPYFQCGMTNITDELIIHDIRSPFYQMLTGDFSFPLWLDDFYNKNERLLNKVAIASIPHHGSINNWNDEVLRKINSPKIWVASHGVANKHKHPSDYVKNNIQQNHKEFMSVTENNAFEYCGCFIWN